MKPKICKCCGQMIRLKSDPVRHCKYCNKEMKRKRYKSGMETRKRFAERDYCNRVCLGQGQLERKSDPDRHCKHCGKLIERKRFDSGLLETHQNFIKRQYCDRVCVGKWKKEHPKPVEMQECKCPKCEKKHKVKAMICGQNGVRWWTGNGMPWKRCESCKRAKLKEDLHYRRAQEKITKQEAEEAKRGLG